MNILYVVCPNGYGHIKRSTIIAEKLIEIEDRLKFSWYISNFSKKYFISVSSNALIDKSIIYSFGDNESISLSNMKLIDFENQFIKWSKKLKKIVTENAFDLVVSDNLATPLDYHSKCIMVGSFVWHDVIIKNSINENVLNHEMEVFRDNYPTIFAMENFAMPELLNYGNVIEIPSISDKYLSSLKKSDNKNNILITGGKSGELSDLLSNTAQFLSKDSSSIVYYDEILGRNLNINGGKIFDYADHSFLNITLIICRPGIGIITDSIKFCKPLIVDIHYENKEMEFNANRIEELGIGVRFDFTREKDFMRNLSNLLDDSTKLNDMVNKIRALDTGGASIIAKNIIELI